MEIEKEDAIIAYRDQQGGLHSRPDVRGLWAEVYLCRECAEVYGWA